jgi:exosortase A-associated hydrolase 1
MMYDEYAFFFDCGGESLPGVISRPVHDAVPRDESAARIGVLILVGGPQYRVGSHRQFVLLARMLATAGVPCMRFDCRGIGDATGSPSAFEGVENDIRSALDAFFSAEPTLTGVLLWGLCDGASAAALYAGNDPRVDGLLLINPWVCTEVGAARIRLRHYYLQRLCSRAFWAKLIRGGVTFGPALGELWRSFRHACGLSTAANAKKNLPDRMQAALQMLSIPWWVILSGQDYVAREFDLVAASPAWAELFPARAPYRLPEADHTFSSAIWRNAVANKTLDCVRALTEVAKLLKSA